MEQPIKLYLISGFLGSGKTTLLKNILKGCVGQRIGLIVNEFGSVGVDGGVLNSQGVRMVEINNGSIFCACLKDGFMRTLKAFTEQPIDILFIENSGMADPSSMNKIMDRMKPHFSRPYDYRGSICMIDGQTFLRYVQMLMPTQNQVRSSDFIIVNKTDLIDREQLEEVHKKIKDLNAEAFVYDTTYASVPMDILEDKLKNLHYTGESTGGTAYRMNTFLLHSKAICSKEQLQDFCMALTGLIWRIKGFIKSDEGWWHIDGTGGQAEVRVADEAEINDSAREKLVIISRGETAPELYIDFWRVYCQAEASLL